MKVTFISLLLMLVSVMAVANESGPFKLQFVIDKNPVRELLVDPAEYGSQEFNLTEKLRLLVTVNPQNSKNVESVLYSQNEIIHSAVQAKSSDSNPSFYLICSGKLVQFISPLSGEAPTCPVPSA